MLLCLAACRSVGATDEPRAPLCERSVVARNGELGVQVYRIPALAVACDGTLLLAYDARNDGPSDTPADIDLLLRRSTDLGRTWSAAVRVADYVGGAGATDASLLVERDSGRVFLFYQYAPPGCGLFHSSDERTPASTSTVHPYLLWSDDHGASWQGPRDLIAELKPAGATGFWTTSGHGLQLSRHARAPGRLLQGSAWLEADGRMRAANVYSDDRGATWRLGPAPGTGLDENKAVELADGRVLQNYRAFERERSTRLQAWSEDGGVTFSPPEPVPALPDPRNNADLVRVFPDASPDSSDAQLLLFSNTPDPKERRDLTLRLSFDSGRTWPVSKRVEEGESMYSVLARLPDGSFGLCYEAKGALHFVRFELAWLLR